MIGHPEVLMGAYYRALVSCRDGEALACLRGAGLSESQAVSLFTADISSELIHRRRVFTSTRLGTLKRGMG